MYQGQYFCDLWGVFDQYLYQLFAKLYSHPLALTLT